MIKYLKSWILLNLYQILQLKVTQVLLEEEVLFLLIGVPSGPNRVLRNKPTFFGEMKSVSFDYLTTEEVKEIIKLGGQCSNVEFREEVVEKIIEFSMKNTHLVQCICRKLVESKNILRTSVDKVVLSNVEDVRAACIAIAQSLDADYACVYADIVVGAKAQQK